MDDGDRRCEIIKAAIYLGEVTAPGTTPCGPKKSALSRGERAVISRADATCKVSTALRLTLMGQRPGSGKDNCFHPQALKGRANRCLHHLPNGIFIFIGGTERWVP
jgi:hypothetical protein